MSDYEIALEWEHNPGLATQKLVCDCPAYMERILERGLATLLVR